MQQAKEFLDFRAPKKASNGSEVVLTVRYRNRAPVRVARALTVVELVEGVSMELTEGEGELALWRRVQNGETSRFAELIDSSRALVQGQIQRGFIRVSLHDLEELEQAVWVAVWRALPRFRGQAAYTTWLTAIARRTVGSWVRRGRAQRSALERLDGDAGVNLERGWESEMINRLTVQEALGSLTAGERQLIELRYYRSLTDEQIARWLDVPLGTVKGRLRASLKRLRALV